jgi:phage head maturation protease
VPKSRDDDAPNHAPQPGEVCQRDFTGSTSVRRNRSSGEGEPNRTTVTINTDDEDRHGTIIEPEGARLERYNDNPVVLINHRRSMVAGTSTVSLRDGKLVANMEDSDWDRDDPEITRWFNKVTSGIISAASIGFRAHEREKELIDEDGDPYDYSNVRYRITDWSLLEWSFVAVPSNPGALVTARQLRQQESAGSQAHAPFGELAGALTEVTDRLEHVADGLTQQNRTDDDSHDDEAAPSPSDAPEKAAQAADSADDERDASAASGDEDAPPPSPRVVKASLADLRELAGEATKARKRNARTLAKRRLGKA